MARVLAISNQKGGVGKTTTAINLAASLAAAERKTLLIDIDPQGNASSGLGLDRTRLHGSIREALLESRPPTELAQEGINPKLTVEGILLTMFDPRANIGHQVAEEVRRVFPELVFKAVVPRNVRLAESPSFGKPILLYDIKSKGCEAYLKLA